MSEAVKHYTEVWLLGHWRTLYGWACFNIWYTEVICTSCGSFSLYQT